MRYIWEQTEKFCHLCGDQTPLVSSRVAINERGILRKITQQKVKIWYYLVSTYLSQHSSSSLSICGISKLSRIVGTR